MAQNHGSRYGYSVASLGDVDGDGDAEVAFTGDYAVTSSGDAAGIALAYSGATQLWSKGGNSSWDHFGHLLTAVADLDNDGVRDLIVGTQWEEVGAMADAGSVHAISGSTGQQLWALQGVQASDQFGAAIGERADIDLDGAPEIVVGEPGWAAGR